MTPLPQSVGILPELKQTLKRTCRKETAVSFLKISAHILSKPQALPLFALFTACLTSSIDILLLYSFPSPTFGWLSLLLTRENRSFWAFSVTVAGLYKL